VGNFSQYYKWKQDWRGTEVVDDLVNLSALQLLKWYTSFEDILDSFDAFLYIFHGTLASSFALAVFEVLVGTSG